MEWISAIKLRRTDTTLDLSLEGERELLDCKEGGGARGIYRGWGGPGSDGWMVALWAWRCLGESGGGKGGGGLLFVPLCEGKK